MDSDPVLDSYGTKIVVEVSVRAGDIHSVGLTCAVEIEDYTDRAKAGARLRDVIGLLRDALPVTELRGAEGDWRKPNKDVAVTKEGAMVETIEGAAQIGAAQAALQQKFKQP